MSETGEPALPMTGGCLCGAVRYSIDEPPLARRMCWCRACQYHASGNATVNAIFPVAALTVTGELRDYELIADSGNAMRRSFCPACGTPLFSQGSRRPDLIVVRLGSLDDPAFLPPETQIWTRRRPQWVSGLADIPEVDGQP